MSDSADYDPVLLAWVTPIVAALADVVPAEQLMLVGAQCRDLLHWRYCRGVPPRATNDTDIAVTLNNWDHVEAIRATFPALGSTGHRFLIADRAVDVLPFGEVESPTGTTRHPPGNQLMNVHGCTDAYLRADVLPLPGGLTGHLPQTAELCGPQTARMARSVRRQRLQRRPRSGLGGALVRRRPRPALRRTTPVGAAPSRLRPTHRRCRAARPRHARQPQPDRSHRAGDSRHTGGPRPAGPALRRLSTGLAHHRSFAAPAGRGVTRPAHAGLLNANRNHKCTFSNGASYRIG